MIAVDRSFLRTFYAGFPQTEAGRLFERLVRKILQEVHPYWSQVFREVVPWAEYARRRGLPAKDIGVDLVGYGKKEGKEEKEEVYAIQVKLWDKPLTWNDLGSFVGTITSPIYGFSRGLLVAPEGVTQEAERQLSPLPITLLTEEALLSGVDLASLVPDRPEEARRAGHKPLRPYQEEALSAVVRAFVEEGKERGKLIMPPGTGKTLVALRIAERVAGKGKRVLFLAPSIALLDQSLRAWAEEASLPLRLFAVVSDPGVGRTSEDDLSALSLLSIPPTTDPERLAEEASREDPEAMTVVFSTYQSVEVLEEAQRLGLPPFDLMVLDEAHRTATVRAEGESPFTKVHHDTHVRARRRLYMTATPRVWEVEGGTGNGTAAKGKGRRKGKGKGETPALLPREDDPAPEDDRDGVGLLVYSMDDEEVYGPTLYEYTFTRAVQEGHLTDYKVVVLSMPEELQKDLASYLQGEEALRVEEALKAVGLWKVLQGEVLDEKGQPLPLNIRRAIAFHGLVRESKALEREFAKVAEAALGAGLLRGSPRRVEVRHIDGQMSAYDRKALLDWLRGEPGPDEVRLLTNAKVLTEGIDVPALDAVAFMRPRESVVDVIQAVGRAMRKAPGKDYGYVVLPVVVRGEDEEREIEESGYRAVWQVLSALRSVDKSFEARMRAALVRLSGTAVPEAGTGQGGPEVLGVVGGQETPPVVMDVLLEDPGLRQKVARGLAGKLVKRLSLGRKYLENWAEDVARVAERLKRQVEALAEQDPGVKKGLEELLAALKALVNEEVTREEAVLMLVQHALTKPIFDALFGELQALRQDPVSQALDRLFQVFRGFLEREGASLQDFYEEMRLKAQSLTDEAERADFLRRLYSNFFTKAFPEVADQVGIAYTPVELVDFLVRSADELARKHFGKGLADAGVVALEPFAGTGTFVTRLLHRVADTGGAGVVEEKLGRGEVWANEILLLPYHVLKANVENTVLSLTGRYLPFEGALLTDSFRLAELWYRGEALPAIPLFPEQYGKHLNRQVKSPIQVVLSNPPWRAWVSREGKGKKNVDYPEVRKRVEQTYVQRAKEIGLGGGKKGENLNSLYDQYIQALRMASDRIGEEGIVAFVTNNGWLEGVVARGLRACLAEEFAEVYVYDLRGDARKKGEAWKREGDKVFGQASRAGVCLLLLVKRRGYEGRGKVFLHRVGDGLSREAKLAEVKAYGSVRDVPWREVAYEDWVGRLSGGFADMVPLDEAFEVRSNGVKTHRDAYAFNFSREDLKRHMTRLIDTFNRHLGKKEDELEGDESLIKWDRELKGALKRGIPRSFEEDGAVYAAFYRPFVPMHLYLSKVFNAMTYQLPRIWPTPEAENLAIAVAGKGSEEFSALVTRKVTDLHFIETTQLYPLYVYDLPESRKGTRLLETGSPTPTRRLNLKEEFLRRLEEALGRKVTPEEAFAYLYAVLSHPLYAERFANDLKMDLPRVPIPEDPALFEELARAGQELIRLHADYETLDPWKETPLRVHEKEGAPEDPYERYRVEKMTLDRERGTLRYNDWIRIEGIPQEAFAWRPGGYSPLEWMVRFWKVEEKVPKGKGEGIVWDPNRYLRERGEPRYLLDLIGRAVRVSVETVRVHERIRGVLEELLPSPES